MNNLYEKRFEGLSVGTREWFDLQAQVIQERPLMKQIYQKWYSLLLADADAVEQKGILLELGSGGSFLKEMRPEIITSDIDEGIAERVIDARELPFEDNTVQAIFLTHVFHHIPDAGAFLKEAERVLQPGGVVSFIEVSHTPFAQFFFDRFHDEPYDDSQAEWAFNQQDAMMDSNQALSWMVFQRDRTIFNEQFPSLEVSDFKHLPWFSYILSGGVKYKKMLPDFLTGPIKLADALLKPLNSLCGLHWHFTLTKKS